MNLVINDFVGDAAFDGFDEVHPIEKHIQWKTELVRFDSGKEQRNQVWQRPIRHWIINWSVLDESARDKLVELFERAKGIYDIFCFFDKKRDYGGAANAYRGDYYCTYTDWSYTLSTGDTTTQLQKTYYIGETEEWTEDKTRIVPGTEYAPTIKVDNNTKSEGVDYTLDDDTGLITWTGHTPSDGEVVTADYQYYFPVRFDFDTHIDLNVMPDIWQAQGLHLVEVIE